MPKLSDDPLGAFLEVLKTHAGPMRAGEVREALIGRGVDEAAVRAAWKCAWPWLAFHPHIKLGEVLLAKARVASSG